MAATRVNAFLREISRQNAQQHGLKTKSRAFASTSRLLEEGTKPELPAFNPSPAFRLTRSPNPSWKTGQGLSDEGINAKAWKKQEEEGWRTWDLKEMQPKEIYPLMTSSIVPRPIAFVSSLSAKGLPNLAPFSYFSMVAHNPPLLSISFSIPSIRPKDTRENILATNEFTVNIISEPFVEAANATSVEAPDYLDEWVISGLTMIDSVDVKPTRVRESAVSYECELFHAHDITPPSSPTGQITHTLILGLIKRIHARNAVMNESGTMVDAGKLKALSRLGGPTYGRIGEGFDVRRPSWRKMQEEGF